MSVFRSWGLHSFALYIQKRMFRNRSVFQISKEEQLDHLNSVHLGTEQLSDLQRSYLQYKAQMYLDRSWKELFLNMLCLMLMVPTIVYLLCVGKPVQNRKYETVNLGNHQKLPKVLMFEGMVNVSSGQYFLRWTDLNFLWREVVVAHPFAVFFAYKSMLKIASYRWVVEKYPSATTMLVNSEYSFTSSILTRYCESLGVQHINYMHGEKLFYIRDSFFRFHRCLVWDQHYVELFRSMYAEKDQFEIESPRHTGLGADVEKLRPNESGLYYYYLQGGESEAELEAIKRVLQTIAGDQGYRVRPHPRYSDRGVLVKIYGENQLDQLPSVRESMGNAEFVIAKYSTVLFEAYIEGKQTIIDDVTNPALFQSLVDLDYIMLERVDTRLSTLCE